MHVLAIRDAERRNLVQGKGSYSDRKRALKWVLLVTVARTVLDATASVRQDQRQYCVLVTLPNHLFCNASLLQAVSRTLPRTHPVGAVVMSVLCLS